jgi:hypothetical protein
MQVAMDSQLNNSTFGNSFFLWLLRRNVDPLMFSAFLKSVQQQKNE